MMAEPRQRKMRKRLRRNQTITTKGPATIKVSRRCVVTVKPRDVDTAG